MWQRAAANWQALNVRSINLTKASLRLTGPGGVFGGPLGEEVLNMRCSTTKAPKQADGEFRGRKWRAQTSFR